MSGALQSLMYAHGTSSDPQSSVKAGSVMFYYSCYYNGKGFRIRVFS